MYLTFYLFKMLLTSQLFFIKIQNNNLSGFFSGGGGGWGGGRGAGL